MTLDEPAKGEELHGYVSGTVFEIQEDRAQVILPDLELVSFSSDEIAFIKVITSRWVPTREF